jgi:hypothetical protein
MDLILLTEPTSSKGLKGVGRSWLPYKRNGGSLQAIESRQFFKIATKDPETYPLPGREILQIIDAMDSAVT